MNPEHASSPAFRVDRHTARPYETTVYASFLAHAQRTPAAIALECGRERYTYRALRDWSFGISRVLRTRGVVRDEIVGVYVDKTPGVYAAILGVLGSGAAYLPIEPSWPDQFATSILHDAGCTHIVATSSHAARVATLGFECVRVESCEPATEPVASPAADDLSYVLCTSGSTGRPKATSFDHRALSRVAAWQTERSGCVPGMRTAQFAVLSFDVSLQEMFSTWTSGGTLSVVPPAIRTDAPLLLAFLRAERLERVFMSIAVLTALAEAAVSTTMEDLALREVVCGGDTMVLSTAIRDFFRRLPACTLDNQYGPTETHGVTAFRMSGDPGAWPSRPPIGRPVGSAEVYLLDDDLARVPRGAFGEIFVSGPGVARGYVGQPDLTAAKFLPCPFIADDDARMYRTGDLARELDDGVLEFHGRRDLQVKIRGYRVELSEVEAVLKRHPRLTDVAVIAVTGGTGVRRLAACYVAASDVAADELSAFVAQALPDYALPASWRRVAALPLNANGKVDRRRLEADLVADLVAASPAAGPAAAADALDSRVATLADIWREVFPGERIDPASNFFALGGDSLRATRIVRLIEPRFGVQLSAGRVFETQSLADLASTLPDLPGSAAAADACPAPANEGESSPLSDMQLVYVAARARAVCSPSRAAHVYVEYDADAPDLPRVERAIRMLMARHEMLRTLQREDGRQQAVGNPAAWQMDVHDLRALDETGRQEALRRWRTSIGHTPRELDAWPPWSVTACRITDDLVRFLVRFDLLTGDLRSMQVVVREFTTLYAGAVLPSRGRPYREFLHERQAAREAATFTAASNYWRDRIGDVPDAPALPLRARALESRDVEFMRRTASLSRAATGRFEARAREHGVTMTAALLAAYAAVLATWSSEPRFTITLPILDRDADDGWDHTVGDFSSVLPVVVDTAADTFAALARNVQRQVLQDYQHRGHGTVDLLRRLASRGGQAPRSPFGVVFTSTLGAGLSGFEAAIPGWHERVHYSVAHTPQVWLDTQVGLVDGRLHYNQDCVESMFEEGVTAAIAAAWHALLERLSGEDASAWESRPCLTSASDLTLAAAANQVTRDRPAQTLHGLFLAKAAAQPDAPAIVWSTGRLTYRGLHHHAIAVCRQLRALGVRAGDRVGVALDKGWRQVAAVLGIHGAGAAYVPVDRSWPAARMHTVLSHARVSCVLVEAETSDETWPGDIQVCVMTDAAEDPSDDARLSGGHERDLAYVIYTSGSTGVPKGVAIDHRGAVNTILDVNERWDVGPFDRLLALSSLSFDLSVYDIFGVLAAGGTIVMPDRDKPRDPDHWRDAIERHGVTLWNSVPALMDMFVTSLDRPPARALASLRLVLLSGDWVPKSLYPRLEARCPAARVIALGGATEASIWSIFHEITGDEPTESIPYGRPLTNQAWYVCDSRQDIRPVGVAGELYIGGIGVALEYFGDPERTRDQFIDHPTRGRLFRTGDYGRRMRNGEIELLGRRDTQIKINGYRIELAEVDATLAACPGVDASAATIVGLDTGTPRIVAFVATRTPAGAAAYLPTLRAKLPAYMLPAEIREVTQLPLTDNGKVDQAQLRQLAAAARTPAAPTLAAPATEQRVAVVFARLLGEDEAPDVTRNLFELGINSLHLVRAFNELAPEFPEGFTAAQMFAHPTVRELAALIDGARPAALPCAPNRPRRMESGGARDIAVVAVAGRFPGARNIEELWRNLADGIESIRPLSEDELRAAGTAGFASDPSFVAAGAVIDDVETFDGAFFGMDAREAELCDPQHRLFLECAWEALEQAGCDPVRTPDRVGVFAGANMSTYLLSNLDPGMAKSLDGLPGLIGNDKDYLATRVSYRLNLRGPSVTVQTACSTSLVAVHLACQSLLAGECDLALAGGAAINVPQTTGYRYQEGGPVSPDGHCRAFDADGQGTVLGNGVGVVALKRLEAAVRAGDPIAAVIKGTAINNDGGTKVGFTAPSMRGQAEVVAQALAVAGVAPETLGYVEAHGTGTALGDPIEVAALRQAFGEAHVRDAWCALGSVKTNLGHLDCAAGVAGLIKTVLCLQHGELVPSLHYRTANPGIAFAGSPFYVNTQRRPWPRAAGVPRRAGVSSFGIGGTNAHVVLEEAPASALPASSTTAPGGVWLLPLSARSRAALEAQRTQWEAFLDTASPAAMAAIAYTAAVRRSAHRYRLAVTGDSVAGWRTALAQARGRAADTRLPIGWVFAGQGPLAATVGAELWRDEPVFRDAATAAIAALACAGWQRPGLFETPLTADERADPAIVQPVLFAVQWSLAALWQHWGVTPAAVVGHSLGEVAAACVVGALSLEAGARVVVERSRLLATRRDSGAMVAVALGPKALNARLAETTLSLAVCNSPTSCVVAGPADAVAAWVSTLPPDVSYRWLPTDGVAGHSPQVAGLDDALTARLSDLTPQASTRPYYSAVEGGDVTGVALDATYWGRNLRAPVQFAAALTAALDGGVTTWLELSAHPVLTLAVTECADTRSAVAVGSPARDSDVRPVLAVGSLMRKEGERSALLASAGRLWEAGATLDWSTLAGPPTPVVPLPAYPWQRQRCWIERPPAFTMSRQPLPGMPGFTTRVSSPALGDTLVYEGHLDVASLPFLSQHRLHGRIVVPGSLLIELLLEAAAARFTQGRPTLRDVMLHAPLTLDESDTVTVQALITREDHDGANVTLHARLTDDDEWTLHASASTFASLGAPPDLSAERWSDICTAPRMPVDAAVMYRTVASLGVDYGPDFQTVVQAARGQSDALAEIRGPVSGDWRLHPVSLDGCLQAVGVTFADERQLYVPAACDAIRWFAPLRGPVWSYVVARPESSALRVSADVHIIDARGAVAAELIGVQFAPAGAESYWSLPGAVARATCEVEWIREDSQNGDNSRGRVSSSGAHAVLILGDGAAVGTLRDACRERSLRVASAGRGPQFRERLRDAVSTLTRDGGPVHVVSLLALDGASPDSVPDSVIHARCTEALDTLQTLAECADERMTRCWFVTRGAWALAGNPGADMTHATIWGLVRTAALEHPELAPSLLDLDPRGDDENDAGVRVGRMIDRLCASGAGEQIAIRDGHVYGPRLVQAALAMGHPPNDFSGDGSFLVTGAFGGLGVRLIDYLIQRGATRMVLTGRTLSDERQVGIAHLRERGIDVHAVAVDLSNEPDVRALVASIPPRFMPLRGVFHLALELADASLLNQTADSLRRPLLSKAQAAWHLHAATATLGVEHFVLFSSVLSVLGGTGQANYTAACAAVDALALHRRANGLPALVIGWGPWAFASSAGLAAVQLDQQPFSAMIPMPEDTGFQILDALLAANRPSTIVAAFDRREWKRVYGRRSPILDALAPAPASPTLLHHWRSALLAAAPADRPALIEQYLAAEISGRLRRSVETLSIDEPLASYAIDSLAMLEVRSHIHDDLGVLASPRMFFEHPTIRLLAAAIADLMATRDRAADVERLTRTLERIDDLSDDEVEATLATLARGGGAHEGVTL